MKLVLTAFLLLLSSLATAEPMQGQVFMQTQQPIPTQNPAKVEVLELFWYGCPHCYHLEPQLAEWVKKLPKDVEFQRVPGRQFHTAEPISRGDKSICAARLF